MSLLGSSVQGTRRCPGLPEDTEHVLRGVTERSGQLAEGWARCGPGIVDASEECDSALGFSAPACTLQSPGEGSAAWGPGWSHRIRPTNRQAEDGGGFVFVCPVRRFSVVKRLVSPMQLKTEMNDVRLENEKLRMRRKTVTGKEKRTEPPE